MILSLNNVFFLFLVKHIASGTLTFKKKRTLIFSQLSIFFSKTKCNENKMKNSIWHED